MKTDFLIIGSGISGLNFALNAAQKGKVLIVTKKKIIDAGTNYAQGGIAAVLDKTDNFKEHIKDTLEAGAYHNNKKAVEFMIENSAPAIHKLMDLGVKFEMEKNQLKLTREGGHHKNRIAYVGDYTGKEIETVLVKRVRKNPNITIFEDAFALKLITYKKQCFGAQVIRKNKIENIFASNTIIATGGIGQLFKHTTNPSISTGDGIALAVEAGCKVKDMEFIQFHPTALDERTAQVRSKAKNLALPVLRRTSISNKQLSPLFLMSETLRGEGAILVNSKGKRFMKNIHPLEDLAPRDIVAREIYKQTGPVYLDMTNKKPEFLRKRFPQIYAKLKSIGIDMGKDLIPVTPAAHYICGGVVTDLHGQTNIKNLFAFGEVTCTGVHGANRLASNSLLEALVFSNQIIKKLSKDNTQKSEQQFQKSITAVPASGVGDTFPKLSPLNSAATKTAKKLKLKIKDLMWHYAGIIRNCEKIKKEAVPKLKKIETTLKKIHTTNQEITECKNMLTVALLILAAANKRKESLGCHFVRKQESKN